MTPARITTVPRPAHIALVIATRRALGLHRGLPDQPGQRVRGRQEIAA